MPELGRFARELRSRFWKPTVEQEVEAELAYHLEMLEADLIAEGLEPHAARRAALQRFGDSDRIGADCRVEGERRDRERRRTQWLAELAHDTRYALRQLRANPRFTIAAVLTLALGLGASTTIFSIANAILLRPLPFPAADRLLIGYEVSPTGQDWSVSQPNYLDWQARARSFTALGAFASGAPSLTGDGDPEQLSGARVTHSFFAALQVPPMLGRAFVADEDRPGGDRAVAVIGHALWQRRFGGDPQVLQQTVTLEGVAHRIVGVMPPAFDFPERSEVWTPLAPDPAAQRGDRRLILVGRLAEGEEIASATAEVQEIASQLAGAYVADNADWSARLQPMSEWYVPPQLGARLRVLLVAVGLLLLMACVNVASLLVARAGVREREFAVRRALGAGRGRLVRQLLTEGVALAALAGAVGTALAAAAAPLVRHTGSAAVPQLATLSIDWRVLLFALGACLLTGVLFGLAPALRLAPRTGGGPLATLRGGTRVTDGRRLRSTLIVTSVALATLLLVCAGLVGSSFLRLMSVELGFAPEQVITASVVLPAERYDEERTARFHAQLERQIAALPGVIAAGATNIAPFSGSNTGMGWEVAARSTGRTGDHRLASWRSVTPGYFGAVGIPLLRGRLIDATDGWDAPNVVVVNEALARAGWADADPIGAGITLSNGQTYQVVGVVGDTRHLALDSLPSAAVYLPHRQFPWPSMWLTVRAIGDPALLLPGIRREVAVLDPEVPIARAQPLTQLVSDVAAEPRLTVVVFSLFGASALVLAAIGLYGIVSYTVVHRTRELGIRMALGATPRRVVGGVLADGVRLALLGIVLGAGAAYAVTGSLGEILYDTAPGDPATFAGVAALLVAVAFAASAAPARRAARLDPATTLRSD